jgi:hypothetical protein
LYERAALSEAIEAGPHNSFLLFWRKPFDGQAGDHTAELHCANCGMLPQSRGVAFDDGHPRQFLAEDSGQIGLAFESDDALGWAAGPNQSTGKAPGSRPQFEHRARSRKIYLGGYRVREANTAGMAAAMRKGFCTHRAKNTPASAAMLFPLTIFLAPFLVVVCYSFTIAKCWL